MAGEGSEVGVGADADELGERAVQVDGELGGPSHLTGDLVARDRAVGVAGQVATELLLATLFRPELVHRSRRDPDPLGDVGDADVGGDDPRALDPEQLDAGVEVTLLRPTPSEHHRPPPSPAR